MNREFDGSNLSSGLRARGWALAGLAAALLAVAPGTAARAAEPWITTWAATPAPRWADELPVPFGVPEVLGETYFRNFAREGVRRF